MDIKIKNAVLSFVPSMTTLDITSLLLANTGKLMQYNGASKAYSGARTSLIDLTNYSKIKVKTNRSGTSYPSIVLFNSDYTSIATVDNSDKVVLALPTSGTGTTGTFETVINLSDYPTAKYAVVNYQGDTSEETISASVSFKYYAKS